MSKHELFLDSPEPHDFPAAQDFLELHFSDEVAKKTTSNLRKCSLRKKKAKDILRASGLSLLPKSNAHVAHNVDRVRNGEKLSPVLLVRGFPNLIIADGYHRVCAIYYLSEDLDIPCFLANLAE